MNTRTRTAALAVSGLVAIGGVAACGSSSSGSTTAGSTTSAAPSASSASPVAAIPSLTGVHTQVALDSGFLAALKSLKVTAAPVGTATISKKGVATFPITGGSATYYTPGTRTPYVESSIKHQGSGLSLTAGGTTVKLTNFVVNAGTSMLTGKVTVNGKLAYKSTPLFFLNGKTLQPLKMGANSTAILTGTKVYLTSSAAQALSSVYKLKAGTLSAKTLIGVATITLKVPTS